MIARNTVRNNNTGPRYILLLPKQCLLCRVPGGLCYGWAMGTAGVCRLGARARTVCFTVLGASYLRHSAVEWSLAAL